MKQFVAACVICAGLGSPAMAQSTQADPTAQTQTDVGSGNGTLSDKLSQTGGVIHPQQSVDPKMQKAAPATGTMPVIRPPGSPGGSTDVQPK